ncbi:transglutaminase [Devosia pacifica]|uniref:Transglutaminase n=1 Tax=Devosia pacifica TaxID=1335967 RepID=A0A918RZV3_9HYPH|nr:transglutaminase family protein [Devosia pacifica]GHA17880.1 transglutaminase [Devosia pacifica]
MLYDIRLELHYDYDAPVSGGRHLIRVQPISRPGSQRVIAASLRCDPAPSVEHRYDDYFGNAVTSIVLREPHESLDIRLAARVQVDDLHPPADLSPTIEGLQQDLSRHWSVSPDSPHHFLASSPRVPLDTEITEFARASLDASPSVRATAMDLCKRINAEFAYDPEATDVETGPREAFLLKKGVCQDFAHLMICGLRGLGIPAGYVSGFLRTNPPPGKPRLEGADAMHAWVRVWCGLDMGWQAFDPTNAIEAAGDHIEIGYGRDYADISPIVGVLKTSGSHATRQSVDVIRLD